MKFTFIPSSSQPTGLFYLEYTYKSKPAPTISPDRSGDRNSTCLRCGKPALILFTSIDCETPGCH